MPILAVLITSLASALASFFVKFVSVGLAVKLAAYTAWMAVFTAFLISVYVCVSSLLTMTQSMGGGGGGGGGGGADWVSYFWMGLGMFVPANAGAVLSCVASIWIATYIYKTQQRAIFNFAK